MTAVIYGAGNIGRGFIARLFASAGYDNVFIDVTDNLINALNREKRYPVRLLSEETKQDVWIEGVSAINGNDTEAAAEAISNADIMATAVGVRIIPYIAPLIAKGIAKRFNTNQKPLNIIICENLIDADELLSKLIKEKLASEEKVLFDQRIGLVRASIGCMVPIQTDIMKDGCELRLCTEDYSQLPVDKKAFRGDVPEITGMYAHDNFGFYIERKLFIHNMGHGICAYLGLYSGYKYIYETINDSRILSIAQNAMLESASALSKKHNESMVDLRRHITDLIKRFSNKALGDTCLRVGVDTARKLGHVDRFIGAIDCCAGMNLDSRYISLGAAAALFQYTKENNMTQTTEEASKVLTEVSAMPQNHPKRGIILSYYSKLLENKPLDKLIQDVTAQAL